MCDIEINDIRIISEFNGITFSKYKKTEVVKKLIDSIKNSKLEHALYWSAELISSAHFIELWDIIINFYSKYIQIVNPKLIIYLEIKYNIFKTIINIYKTQELYLRNIEKIRKLFAEIICILCFSVKTHTFQTLKIKPEEFVLTNITNKLKAENVNYISTYYQDEDPMSLFIPFNEFVYSINIKNTIDACYWFEYILNFENNMKKNGQLFKAERRGFNVDTKLQCDIVWIFWQILLDYAEKENTLILKIIKSSLNMYCIKYSSNTKIKRKLLLYFVITLLCSNISIENISIITDNNKTNIGIVLSKLSNIYKQIKENEISPKTDYLFSSKNKNTELTMQRLNMMNAHDISIRNKDDDNEDFDNEDFTPSNS